jgi:hypothetical protein
MTFGVYLFIGAVLVLVVGAILVSGLSKNKVLKIVGVVAAVVSLYILVFIVSAFMQFFK